VASNNLLRYVSPDFVGLHSTPAHTCEHRSELRQDRPILHCRRRIGCRESSPFGQMLTLQKYQHSVSGSISRLFAAVSTYPTPDLTPVLQFRFGYRPYVCLGDTAHQHATGSCRPRRRYCKHCCGCPWRKSLFEDAISLHIPLGEPGDVIVITSFYYQNELG